MGQGSYVICEWDSVAKEFPNFQQAFRSLEAQLITKCLGDWAPKTFGSLTPNAGQFGRTTILPALFDTGSSTAHTVAGVGQQFGSGLGAVPAPTDWRQLFIVAGDQELLRGAHAGDTIPEDFKVAWMGLAFPNQQQHITEIKFQIGDRKFGRINLEEMLAYNKPAIIFEEGFIIDEEQSFHLWGYVEGPIPTHHDGWVGVRQRIVPIGAAYYKVIDKVLGNCGAII